MGEEATVFAEVRTDSRPPHAGRAARSSRPSCTTAPRCSTITFFNQAWREKQLSVGTEASFFGKLDVYRGKRQMTNPVVDVVGRGGCRRREDGRDRPRLPAVGQGRGVHVAAARAGVGRAREVPRARLRRSARRERCSTAAISSTATTALRAIHRPESMGELGAAKRRLIFDEFLRMQVGLVARKRAFEAEESGIRHDVDGPLVDAFVAQLPFSLTGDQQARARRDHARSRRARADAPPPPGRRRIGQDGGRARRAARRGAGRVPGRVHGADRGARRAALPRFAADARGADRSRRGLAARRSTRSAWRCSRTARPRPSGAGSRPGSKAGEIDILVGTHALLYGDAQFSRLGLAVIDEQHRFGVEQRALAAGQGRSARRARHDRDARSRAPRRCSSTATSTSRNSASCRPGAPRSRRRSSTRRPLAQAAAWEALRAEVAAGHQAYVVCPLVEDKGKVEAKAATAEYERLQAEELHDLRVGLLHGQMPAEGEGSRRCGRSGAARSTCSSPPR